ncbi:MAG: NGG1p interacting factor NIF3 [Alkalispirochaeta sp.]
MFKLVFFVPKEHVEEVKVAVFKTGAGKYEKYDSCSWQAEGTGQFRPAPGSDPFIGSIGEIERVPECRVEILCRDEVVRPAIEALLAAHPYEEVAYEVYEVWQQPNLPSRIP